MTLDGVNRRLLLVLLCVMGACRPSVSTARFSQEALVVRGRAGTVLPPLVCSGAGGEPLPVPRDAAWSVEPGDLGEIREGRFHPWRSGDGAVVARLNGGRIAARLAVTVEVVDAVRLRCPAAGCVARVGMPLRLQGHALAGDTPLAGVSLRWSTSDEAVAAVDDSGLLTPRTPGVAVIEARAYDRTASVRVTVLGEPDEIVLRCPAPAFSVAYQEPLGMRGTATACGVMSDRPTHLAVELRLRGEVLPVGEVTWRSGDERVATVSGGVVSGLAKGTTFVEARAGTLSVSIPVSVVPGNPEQAAHSAPEGCPPADGPVQIARVRTASGTTVVARCRSAAALSCFRQVQAGAEEPEALSVAEQCCCEGDLSGAEAP